MQPNKLIIFTAPSGAGKTTIVHHLLKIYADQLAFSISAATRLPRSNEKDGVDYYFMTPEAFRELIHQEGFAEWEMVYEGKYYGTLKKELERIWAMGKTPVLDIDVKGAIHIQQQYPGHTLSVFVAPPSLEILRKRLESRGTESPASLQDRLNKAAYEISFKEQFSRILVNDNLQEACAKAEEIVREYLRS